MQVQKQMYVSEWPGEIQQHRALASKRGQLHPEVYRHRCRSYAAFRSHDHDQLVLRAEIFGVQVFRKTEQEIFERLGLHRFAEKILHAAAHGLKQQAGLRWNRRRTRDQLDDRLDPAQLIREREKWVW